MESRIVTAIRQLKEIIMNPSKPGTGLRGLVATAMFVVLAPSLSNVSAADPYAASRTVKFADLNMSTPSGVHVLYTRILAAASRRTGIKLVACAKQPQMP
jgi:UrcA family protein